MSTALVFGASGLVGGACLPALAAAGFDTVGTGLSRLRSGLIRLDFGEPGAAAAVVRERRPDVIVLSAAQPNVDGCEERPVEAWRLNAAAPAEIALAARDVGAFVAFVSTDYVFDGTGPRDEDDALRPLNAYGRAKAAAELAIRTLLPDRGAVLRTTGVYGWERGGKNFVLQLLGRLPKGERMRVVTDQIGTPTSAASLAEAIAIACQMRASGVFHAVGADAMPRLELGRIACDVFGWDASLLEPVTTAGLGQKAARPLDNPLRNGRLLSLMGRPLPGPAEGLRAMRRAMENDRGE